MRFHALRILCSICKHTEKKKKKKTPSEDRVDKYQDTAYMRKLKKKIKRIYFLKRNKLTNIDNKHGYQRGKRWEG